MTNSTTHSTNEVTLFRKDFVREWGHYNEFAPYMGTTQNAPIMVVRDASNKSGRFVSIPLIQSAPRGSKKTGNTRVQGSEIVLANTGFKLPLEVAREGWATTEREEQSSAFSLLKAFRGTAMQWAVDLIRDDVIIALGSIHTSTTGGDSKAYSVASEAEKDAWLVQNKDRFWIGDGTLTVVGTDHSAELTKVTATMNLSADIVTKMKNTALKTSSTTGKPRIAPISVKKAKHQKTFLMLTSLEAHAQLAQDPVIIGSRTNAAARGAENPMFQGGDIFHDGVIVRACEDIALLENVGASSADLSPVYLLGQAALAKGVAMDPKMHTDDDDYGFINGVEIRTDYNIRKTVWQMDPDDATTLTDFGMVTGFVGVST